MVKSVGSTNTALLQIYPGFYVIAVSIVITTLPTTLPQFRIELVAQLNRLPQTRSQESLIHTIIKLTVSQCMCCPEHCLIDSLFIARTPHTLDIPSGLFEVDKNAVQKQCILFQSGQADSDTRVGKKLFSLVFHK
ncbi:hypothetical protein P805_01817 [Serratia marcescens BIDMC 44]|nr:hypothetical protein P805_01817 [Serratia marcescens BIDMC 44]